MNWQSTNSRRLPISNFDFRISNFRRPSFPFLLPPSSFLLHPSAIRRRPGYSMAELMIVVTIMVMLVAVTLPIAKKVMDDSHVREASRQLNAYFTMAKARAIHTGRPCGIFFDCSEVPAWAPNARFATEMHLAEVPAPYAGSTTGARGRIVSDGMGGFVFSPVVDLGGNNYSPESLLQQSQQVETPILLSLIDEQEEFFIQFDHKGLWFPCQRVNGQLRYPALRKNITLIGTNPPGMNLPSTHPGFSYQIRRAPRKVGNALAMPTGTCIDMTHSGSGPGAVGFSSGLQALAVMFTPNGGVDELHMVTESGGNLIKSIVEPTNTLFFLIGKVERVNDPSATAMYDIRDSNAADPTSLWVTVGRENAQVTTSENLPPPVDLTTASLSSVRIFPGEPQVQSGGRGQNLNLTLDSHRAIYLRHCREIASSREQMKGR
jgi:type II secretory pathway pseudopilin PulG